MRACPRSLAGSVPGRPRARHALATALVAALFAGCVECPPGTSPESGACLPDCPDPLTYYADVDGDGFGDPASPLEACTQPDGFVRDATDCDDDHADTAPGMPERCDGRDNDCNGTRDDGFECTAGATVACATTCGTEGTATCTDACVPPEACEPPPEVCNLADDDCDGVIDNGVRAFQAPVEVGPAGANRVRLLETRAGFAAVTSDGETLRVQRLDPSGAPVGSATKVVDEPGEIVDFDADADAGGGTLYVMWFKSVQDERHTFLKALESDTLEVHALDEEVRAAPDGNWLTLALISNHVFTADAALGGAVSVRDVFLLSDGFGPPGPVDSLGGVTGRIDLATHLSWPAPLLAAPADGDIRLAVFDDGAFGASTLVASDADNAHSPVIAIGNGDLVLAHARQQTGGNAIHVQRHDPETLAQRGRLAPIPGTDLAVSLFDSARAMSLDALPFPDGRDRWALAFVNDEGDTERVELRILSTEGFAFWGSPEEPLTPPCDADGTPCVGHFIEVDVAVRQGAVALAWSRPGGAPLASTFACLE